MIAFDIILGIVVLVGFAISARRKTRKRDYSMLKNEQNHRNSTDGIQLIPKIDVADASIQDDQSELDTNPDFKIFMHYISRLIKTKEVGLSFDFENLEYEPQKGKKILQGVTGSIQSGSMWAVMGGSGAGKSTFFNVLMGKSRNTGGHIKVNGHVKDMAKYKKLIGYVPQDDIVIPELTVRENILHSARVRLPMTWRDNDIQAYVDALISCIGLSHVQHSHVGDATRPVVSGGQRKRVSIGMELAAAPMCIFLDEPTSGLDATSASSIMRLLKAISKLGVTTITIIHQPREKIYNGFDNILLLGNGKEIYAGPTSNASAHFTSLGFTFPIRANPADVIMDIITGNGKEYTHDFKWMHDPVNKLVEHWDRQGMRLQPSLNREDTLQAPIHSPSLSTISTPEVEESLRQTMKKRGASWPAQAYYCCKRSITQQVRSKGSFFFEIAIGAIAGGVIGLSASAAKGQLFRGLYIGSFTILSPAVDYQSVSQLGLLGGMAIGLAASAPAVRVFGEEKLIFNREASAGHSMSAYYVGKMLSVLPRVFLSSLHYSVFMGILATPLMSWEHMFIAILLYFFCVYGLASCVGMVVKREDGPLLAVMASLMIGILGGVAPPLSKVAVWKLVWLWRLSPGVWFAEAFVGQCFLPLDYLYNLDAASRGTGFKLGQFTLDMG
jgi:ABC-type multidrug transport system ATPase subunit